MTVSKAAVRVRYAPSPTGKLHVGNLRTGLFAWLFARQQGGLFILRIEDTDRARSSRESETGIYEDLRWFGMDWDEGPDVGGPYGPYRQSERDHLYLECADRLLDAGSAYRCFCTEEELTRLSEAAAGSGAPMKYPGTCRNLVPGEVRARVAAGEQHVIRLRVRDGAVEFDDLVHGPTRFDADVISDPILLRSDSTPTYNFAVVVDDALMAVSHVIRGDDHLSNTPKQVLIYEAMDRTTPCFAHLSTVLGDDQSKLSKRHGHASVKEFRDLGYLPEALMNYLALLGWSPGAEGSEVIPPERLLKEFRLDRVNKNPAIFDFGKLRFINRHYLRESPATPELVARALHEAGSVPVGETASERVSGAREWADLVRETLIEKVDIVSDFVSVLGDVLEFPVDGKGRPDCEEVSSDPGALDLIRRFEAEVSQEAYLTNESFKSILGKLKEESGRKGPALFHPLRVALTARSSGPELNKLIPLVETAARLRVGSIAPCRERVRAFLNRYGQ